MPPIWNLYFRFTRAAWGQGFAAEAAREAVIVATERDPRRRVVVRPRPGNDAAQLLTSRIGLARAPELDADGFVTFVSRGPSPRFQLRTRLLAGTAEGRALRG